jgi:hypothetical protein
MAEKYFINASPRINGSHTVHRQQCPLLPEPGRRILLGVFQSPRDAVREGRWYFRRADNCPFCSKKNYKKLISTSFKAKADMDFISSGRMNATWESLIFCSVS